MIAGETGDDYWEGACGEKTSKNIRQSQTKIGIIYWLISRIVTDIFIYFFLLSTYRIDQVIEFRNMTNGILVSSLNFNRS